MSIEEKIEWLKGKPKDRRMAVSVFDPWRKDIEELVMAGASINQIRTWLLEQDPDIEQREEDSKRYYKKLQSYVHRINVRLKTIPPNKGR